MTGWLCFVKLKLNSVQLKFELGLGLTLTKVKYLRKHLLVPKLNTLRLYICDKLFQNEHFKMKIFVFAAVFLAIGLKLSGW